MTTIGGANVIGGGIAELRARLCGRQNLCRRPRWEFGLNFGTTTANDWWSNSGGGPTLPLVDRVYDPTNLFQRKILTVEDVSAAGPSYLRAYCPTGAALEGQTFIVTAWVKALSGDLSDVEIRQITYNGAEELNTTNFSLSEDEWTFYSGIFTWTSAAVGQTDFFVDFFPARNPSAGLGKMGIGNIRVHRVFATVTALPDDPARGWSFRPILRTSRAVNSYGQSEISRRGVIPTIEMRHPFMNKTHLNAAAELYSHRGLLFVEPHTDASIAWWMEAQRDELEYDPIRAVGSEGRLRLVGVDPIYGIPSASVYVEESSLVYHGRPRYYIAP